MTEESFRRKLTAILSADVEGYSRLMGEDEDATIRTLTAYRELMSTLIEKHRGRVVDSPGDNLLAEFLSVVDAVRCAVEIQEELRVRNAELPDSRKMQFRIGINLGDVVEEEERIYGDGINIAARVEGLAEGGGICISGTVYDSIKNKLSLSYESLGEHTVKNIKEPVRVYRMRVGPEAAAPVVKAEKAGPRRWKRTGLAAMVVLVVVVGTWAIWNFYFRPPPIEPASVDKMAYSLPDKPSIAVMPFLNMSADSKQEFFTDGLTEGIITALAKVPQLFVIGRDSTFSYKGKAVKAKQVSEELGVQYVLEGSVQKAGDKARITAQLIDALKGHHLWAERYDRELKDVFAVQDEITKKIITALDVKLTRGEWGRIASKGTKNLDAYLKSQEAAWCADQSTRESLERGRRLSEEAIALDPKYPHPYHVMGVLQMIEALSGFSKNPRESLELANKMQRKAIELDESFAVARAVLGFNLLMLRRYDEAIAEAERAYRLAPGSSSVLYWYGTVLTNYGRPQEAVPILKEVLRLEPIPMNSRLRSLSVALRDSGQYDEAIECIKKAIQREPDSIVSQLILTSTYAYAGRKEEAQAAAREILRINPKFSIERFMRASPQRDANSRKRFAQALKTAGLPEKPPFPLPDKPSIAVLPFANMSEDPDQEYFSDGITEEIITALSKVPDLSVIARNSSFTYKGKSVSIPTVARELGVRYVLEGSVRKAADKVRVTAQLIDAQTNNHLWAERYDRDLKDIFALQDEITMKILTAVRVKLTEGEQARLYGKRAKNLDSYMKVLEGRRYFYRFNRESNLQARQMFEEAIALEPENAHALTMLGWTYLMEVWFGSSESASKVVDRVVKLAQKAISLDDTIDSPHSLLANVYLMKRQFEMAIAEAERGVALSPNGADAQAHLGMILNYAGRREAAIASLEKAIRLNPIPPNWYLFSLGEAYCLAGEHEKSLAAYEQVLRGYPDDIRALVGSTATYSLLGREEEARAQAAQILRVEPKFSLEPFLKTLPFKDKADAELLFDSLHKAGLK